MRKMDELPDHARVWIFQASKFLTIDEESRIREEVSRFLEQWTAHGQRLDASFGIYHHRIVAVAADETMVTSSGCGIDKLTHCMLQLGQVMGIDLFERTVVIFEQQGSWQQAPLHQFWALRKAGVVTDSTRVLDTTVKTIGEMRKRLEGEFSRSWHAEMWGR